MTDPRRKLPAGIGAGEPGGVTQPNPISCPPHFPEYVYEWPGMTLLGAHCAKCNGDYTLVPGVDYHVVEGKR